MNSNKSIACCAAIFVVAAFLNLDRATAEIVFTPSTVVFTPPPAGETITLLDFNHDSLPDFRFLNSRFDACACLPGDPPPPYWVLSLDDEAGATNQMHVVDAPGHILFPPESLAAGTVISSALPYGSTNTDSLFNVVISTGEVRGNFQPSMSPQFVGVKFQIAANTYYGWIGLEVPQNIFDGVRLLGYAYETNGGSIVAGVPEPASLVMLLSAVLIFLPGCRSCRVN
jgi:hypothetical protein